MSSIPTKQFDAGKVQSRVRAREAAVEIVFLVRAEMAEHAGCEDVFLDAIQTAFAVTSDPSQVVRDKPMGDHESADFEAGRGQMSRMPFGMHENKSIGDTPIAYLLWLDGEPDFRRQLNRYLRSDRGQARQEEGEE